VPVFSAVLTPHHFHSHSEHHDYFHRISWSRAVKPRRRALPPWPSWRSCAQRSLNAPRPAWRGLTGGCLICQSLASVQQMLHCANIVKHLLTTLTALG
jgi:hypothetical protein